MRPSYSHIMVLVRPSSAILHGLLTQKQKKVKNKAHVNFLQGRRDQCASFQIK